jgi:uncharacterized protein (TIGR02117 family)
MRRWAKRLALVFVGLTAAFVLLALVTARSGDRALWPVVDGVEVFVVSHGYHAGIVVPREALIEAARRNQNNGALIDLAERFGAFPWLEIGWGDEGFYREVPTVASLNLGLAARALFRAGNPSVLHVVGLPRGPEIVFANAEIVRIRLGAAGFAKLTQRLDDTFARDAENRLPPDLGRGLYGPSLFYRARGNFNLFNVCNHWLARLLDAAGLPTAPVLATLPYGLFLDLRWRAGLTTMPRRLAAGG